tara:strand:+ start:4398 stop:4988 length:591 start_codon:yes stop_codon:yes gene_type:complete
VIEVLAALFARVSFAEFMAVFLAIAYLVLAIRQNICCWLAAFLSSILYIGLFYSAQLYMESILQVFYAVMAIYGWYQWRHGVDKDIGIQINIWSIRQHVMTISTIGTLSLFFGWSMSHTDSASPFLDAFTTVAAIMATYMVACKVLENWLYWFIIDSVSIYLYLSRDLHLTALLFFVYLFLIVIGLRTWWREYRAI